MTEAVLEEASTIVAMPGEAIFLCIGANIALLCMMAVLCFIGNWSLKQTNSQAKTVKVLLEELDSVKSAQQNQLKRFNYETQQNAQRMQQILDALGGGGARAPASSGYLPNEAETATRATKPRSISPEHNGFASPPRQAAASPMPQYSATAAATPEMGLAADIGEREKKFYDSLAALRQRRAESPPGGTPGLAPGSATQSVHARTEGRHLQMA